MPWSDPRYRVDCREFNGYRPCRHLRPCEGCPHYRARGPDVLIINLDGLGDVVRTTALLPTLRRLFPEARVSWLTRRGAVPLLEHVPQVDEIIALEPEGLEVLRARRFELILNADKSQIAAALAVSLNTEARRGFGLNGRGVVVPLNPEAEYLYRLGLDNEEKFLRNRRTHESLLAEAWALPYQGEPAQFTLHPDELACARALRHRLTGGDGLLIGFNTGCSALYPYKQLPIDEQVALIRQVLEVHGPRGVRGVLLGGPGESGRNHEIKAAVDSPWLFESPTTAGLRAGATWIAACDVVVTGDTLALHLAIALERFVVAWFGLTCHQEIDLRGRGVQVLASVACRPCWQQSCSIEPKCNTRVSMELLSRAIADVIDAAGAGGVIRGEPLRWEVPIGGFWEGAAGSPPASSPGKHR